MARLAVHGCFNLQFVFDSRANVRLRLAASRLPGQIGHFVHRAQLKQRVVVALETPAHCQGLFVRYYLHLIHLAVAGDARYALVDVNRVIEERILRQFVDPLPFHRLTRVVTVADRSKKWAGTLHIGLIRVVAVHANLC